MAMRSQLYSYAKFLGDVLVYYTRGMPNVVLCVYWMYLTAENLNMELAA